MRCFSSAILFAAIAVMCFSFSISKPPAEDWVKLKKFNHRNDSFLLAPVSCYYPWDVVKDSSGIFHAITDRFLTAKDTTGFPRTAHIQMVRTGDHPAREHYISMSAEKSGDTLLIEVPMGDGEWFAVYTIRVLGKFHKDTCEPYNAVIAQDHRESGVHFKVTSQLLQLDQKEYNTGDSIKGYLDSSFDIWRDSTQDQSWKANVRLTGTFKTVVK